MRYETVMSALRSYVVVGGWPASIFMIPEGALLALYQCIVANRLRSCLELGSGHGATSCVMAAAVQETGGKVVTIDIASHQPANAQSLKTHVGLGDELEVVIDPLGYNWYMADLISAQLRKGAPRPLFDLCFLDGAHEFQPDALAVFLAIRLLKPGGWLVLDDLNFNLRSMPNWSQTHGHLSDRELDAYQIGMVWHLIVCQHPVLGGFKVTEGGRVGWARKKQSVPLYKRFLNRLVK